MDPLKENQVKGKVLDHLGLVAATIDDLELSEKVDSILPLENGKGNKVSMGQRVKAMILNGLGFMDDRLYMFEQFLNNKPVDRLFDKDTKAEYFNDDALGRCLDAIADYGVTKFFTEVSFYIGKKKKLIGQTIRGDTTTLLVHGEYPEERESDYTGARPKQGYSKCKRGDLKQMVLHLATTGSSGFPIWMESHMGNASDKNVLVEAAKRMQIFKEQLELDDDFIYVGDSAFYSGAVQSKDQMKWISRVPQNIKAAKQLIQRTDIEWKKTTEDYCIHPFKSQYGGVTQRWVLVYSKPAFEREIKTLNKQIEKEESEAKKHLWHLSKERFKCAADAKKEALRVDKFKYHQVSYEIETITSHLGKGRPKKGESPTIKSFKINATLIKDEDKIQAEKNSKGRFILATNELDTKRLSDEECLKEYKKQSSTEASFQFIKNRAFELDSIFLKKPSRINALMSIMTLCLMVYGCAQHQLRTFLKEKSETVPNQLGKETNHPRMQWIYRLFHGIQVLTIQTETLTQQLVINLSVLLKRIVNIFGRRAMTIYGLN